MPEPGGPGAGPIVYDARLQTWLRRRLQLRGPVGLNFEQLVLPSFELISSLDTDQPALRGEYVYSIFLSAPANAAQLSSVALVNPAGSNILAMLDQSPEIQPGAGVQTFRVGLLQAASFAGDALAAGFGGPRDARAFKFDGISLNFLPQSQLIGRTRSGAAGSVFGGQTGNPERQLSGLANTTIFSSVPYVIPPGWGLWIEGTAANAVCAANFNWRERTAGDGEIF